MKLYAQTLHGRPFHIAGLHITPEAAEYEVTDEQAKALRSMAKTASTAAGNPILVVGDMRPPARSRTQRHLEAKNAELTAEVTRLKRQLSKSSGGKASDA